MWQVRHSKEELSCKKKMKTEVKNWVKEVNDWMQEYDELDVRVRYSLFPLIGDPVGKMQCRANQLIEQRKHFKGLVLHDFDNDGVPSSPTKLFGNKIIQKILQCLVVDNISNIGIYGMGGVGKTTLAKHIKSELEKKNYRVYWVTVSKEFSVTSLQDKIANVLGMHLSNRDEEHMRANILRAAFEKMEKSVFIFDDVWEEFHLEDVGITIDPNKYTLIWTTRSQLVCDRMLCQRKFEVPILDKAESWRLFKDTLGHATILPEEVEKIAKSVASRCAGLPLCIVTTAGSMTGITDIHEWNIALEKLKSCSDESYEMEDEEIMEHMADKAFELAVGCFGQDDVEPMKSLKRSRDNLRSQTMDIEDEVKKEEMSCKKKMKTEVKNWVKEVNDWMQEYDELDARVRYSRFPLIGDPVEKMQCRANQLIEQRKQFKGLVLDDFDNDGVPCSPTKLFGNKIWSCLVVDNISSIGIYGMGGVGKTTLAKRIKSELQKENYRVYWVTVSQEFSVTSLQDKIANVLGIKLSKEDEESMRAHILRAAFEKKEKSVLILDDVWEEFSLENVGIAIGPNKFRLILTTRSSLVCDRMLCQRKFKVPNLDDDESWRLFKDTLGHAMILPENVEKIAKSVANMCAGLPLGIVTTASSMRGITDIHEWNIALEKLKSCSDGSYEMEDKVFCILEWSFNRLSGCERPCFLYCCLYPEDHEVEREKLIDLFILAELIPRWDTMKLERSHGHKILNKLVKVCLLEESKTRNGKECVKMHDLIRDMALRITGGKHISKITEHVPMFLVKKMGRNKSNNLLLKNEEWKDDLAAVSLMASSFVYSGNILEIPPLLSPNCRSLSTLIINGANITEIPDSFLQHMYGLKVLNLEWCMRLRLLPKCISDLVNLTALLLEGCFFVESIPSLGKLKKLRILNLFRTGVHTVPQGLEELVNLERLYMSGDTMNMMVGPRAILPEGTFSKLDRLHHLVLPTAAVHIRDLRVLHDLQLYVGGLIHDQFSNSGWWPTHYKIVVLSPGVNEFSSNYIKLFYDCLCLEDLMTSENYLEFQRYNFQKGLDMILPQENLHKLDLSRCSVFSHRLIDGSKDLCHLALRHSKELKFVLNLSSLDDDEGALRNLRTLNLEDLPNLAGIINIGRESGGLLVPPGTFSSLEELYILECHELKKLFSMQLVKQCLQNLRYLDVTDCNGVEEIVANNDDHDLNGGGGGEAIMSRPSSSGHIASTQELLFPKLQGLILKRLPKLENVCSPTIMIGGEEPITFNLYGCPHLKRLPSFSCLSKSLHNPSDKDAVQPFLKGSSSCGELSPVSIKSLREGSNEDVGSSETKLSEITSRTSGVELGNPSRQADITKSQGKETGKNALEVMPCVFTKGDGPNGRRVDGILYKYGKGEEGRIMCVCHGNFLSPAEFVRHAGGTDVTHPLKHIVVNPNASPFQ